MSSIRYPLAIDAGVGGVTQEPAYAAHVEQLMKQVLFSSPGDRINRPEFGCGLRQMVFAPLSEVTETLTKITVFEALERWLGDLISVDSVTVTASNETLEIGIAYALRARHVRRYLNLEVTL